MINNVVTLMLHDLAIAYKNKTLLLILFIPLFIFISLELVDKTDANFHKLRIGLLKKENISPEILQSILSNDRLFSITLIPNRDEGIGWLKDKKIDGVLAPSVNQPQSLELIVLTRASFQTLAIVESISSLQNIFEDKGRKWITDIRPLRETNIKNQTLPTWILMLVLLVAFIILPSQVAEEKEKYLLLGLLQTPIREIEWLLAKLLLGMTLIGVAVLFLHLLGRFNLDAGNGASYLAFLIVGGFCFSSCGIFLGFLCRNQASARTLGVLFYLPLLLPSALSDFSQRLSKVAPLVPSYQFYEPIKTILLEGGHLSTFPLEWVYLFSVGLGTSFFSYLLIKKRWLM